MDQEALETLLKELQPLAEKIGEGATFLWEVSVQQVYVDGVTSIFYGILWMLIVWIVFKLRMYTIGRIKSLYGDPNRLTEGDRIDIETMSLTTTIIASIVGGVFLLLAVNRFTSAFRQLLNPEYYAVDKLLEVMGI